MKRNFIPSENKITYTRDEASNAVLQGIWCTVQTLVVHRMFLAAKTIIGHYKLTCQQMRHLQLNIDDSCHDQMAIFFQRFYNFNLDDGEDVTKKFV